MQGLRNSVTAARLSLDLFRRKGELAGSHTAHALDQSLAKLRDQVEEPLLDEVHQIVDACAAAFEKQVKAKTA